MNNKVAFKDPTIIDEAKVGILAASLLAGILGYVILKIALPKLASR